MSLTCTAYLLTLAVMGSHAQTLEHAEITENLYEGDIVLTPDQEMSLKERKAIGDRLSRWPADADGKVVVPFTLSPSKTTSQMRRVTKAALKTWEDATCIYFQQHESLPSSTPHLSFDMEHNACYSSVGRTGRLQRVNIGPRCIKVGTIAHEVGHALGFFHEQSRSDRDKFVTILFDNVKTGMENNFQKSNTVNYVKYDYASVMHYGDTFFTKNGKLTLRTKNPLYQKLIGQRDGQSFRDFKTLNLHYKCADAFKCGKDNCLNEGYLGKRCACVCPPGTSGDKCQTKTNEYTDAVMKQLQPNSGRVTSAGDFTSPGYPNFPHLRPGFVQVVESKDKCEDVEVTLSNLDLPTCGYAQLFITNTGDTPGEKSYCGRSSSKIVMKGSRVVITYTSNLSGHPTVKGYRGFVKFVRRAGCTSTSSTTSPIASGPSTTKNPTTSVSTQNPATTTTPVGPPTGVTITDTGAKVQLKLAENKCNFKIQKTGAKTYKIYGVIPRNYAKIYCRIPLMTDEPRYMELLRVFGMETNEIQTGSLWNRKTILSSNVDLLYSGSKTKYVDTMVEIAIELINNRCQKVVRLGDKASGTISVDNSPCEFWFMAPAGKKIRVEMERTPASSSSPDCDKRGYYWISMAANHKFTSSHKGCANALPKRFIVGNYFNLRSVHTNPNTAPISVKYKVV